jgi:3-hydroxyisobutyrate dehydrogenase-like beta-hydroxyacid dehydrogenase
MGSMVTIAVVSPGAMGSALGRGYAAGGARVVATVAGRSSRTSRLAHGIELLPTLEAAVTASDIVISVVPPGEALAAAKRIRDAARGADAHPVVADFNAVSPTTMNRISDLMRGFDVVDGSISGGPPDHGTTRLYLSGDRADDVAQLSHPHLDVRLVEGGIGAASAVKMSTASVYKGIWAILLQAVLSAEASGVLDVVLKDLAEEFPTLIAGIAPGIASSASKSHRYVAEMQEIAATQMAAGLSPELFLGMAAVWARVAQTPLGQLSPENARELSNLNEVIRALRP